MVLDIIPVTSTLCFACEMMAHLGYGKLRVILMSPCDALSARNPNLCVLDYVNARRSLHELRLAIINGAQERDCETSEHRLRR
jgi:hypothetical protein